MPGHRKSFSFLCVFFFPSISQLLVWFSKRLQNESPKPNGNDIHLTRSSSVQGWMLVLLTAHKNTRRRIIFELSLLVYLWMCKYLKICCKALRIEYSLSHIHQQMNESEMHFFSSSFFVFFSSVSLPFLFKIFLFGSVFFFYSQVVRRLDIYINVMHAHISVTRTLIDVIKKKKN